MNRSAYPAPSNETPADRLPVIVRGYVPFPPNKMGLRNNRRNRRGASKWTIIVDTETTTDAAQQLRFGTYQVRNGTDLWKAGIFFDPQLSDDEKAVLCEYTRAHNLQLRSKHDFIEQIFYGVAYDLRAAIVGFNLPFDISRLAIGHNSARGEAMRGGFTLQISANSWKPRVQIKHLSARAALMQFTKPRARWDTKEMRRKGFAQPIRRGAFVDVKTIAAALSARSFSLGTLADFLETKHRKRSVDEHGAAITTEYVGYAVNDVQVTWECYQVLLAKFDEHRLKQTGLSQIISEASIGKAYLNEMGIQPWRVSQPDFPDAMIGIIVSTYYGGRSEIHLRRVIAQVLYCDLLSAYPTGCALMGLWRFVIAKGMSWRDSTAETAEFLADVALEDLQNPVTWRRFATLVKVEPEWDVLPVRAKYAGEAQATIGLNHLNSKRPLWFTLADCIVAKLLGGKAPPIVKAITFEPGEMQDGLKPAAIAGIAEYTIDPKFDDFYRRLIDLRSATKARSRQANAADAARLKAEEQALKIIANATSYGIFVEVNVSDLEESEQRQCHGPKGEAFAVQVTKSEQPGRYFHPLLASLITGAARLMLAITETLAHRAGLDWASCDTDAMAIARPEGMRREVFLQAAKTVCDWFTPLNPYEQKDRLLKIEDINFGIGDEQSKPELVDLFCLAISAKRYVLFNIDADGRPIIRKASAHGLGHLLPPYAAENAPPSIPAPRVALELIGVARWQYDLWYQIILATMAGYPDRVDLSYHPALDRPAISRYAATTPQLLRWFRIHNANLAYADQVRPFNFLSAFQASRFPSNSDDAVSLGTELQTQGRPRRRYVPKPIAPYDADAMRASDKCFDRETGKPVPALQLKTYRQALAQYHLSPEPKFLGAEYLDRGPTRRRHVQAISTEHIGKEANRWEEQYFLGLDLNMQIEYGTDTVDAAAIREQLRARKSSSRQLADRAGISRNDISAFRRGKLELSENQLGRLLAAICARGTSNDLAVAAEG